MNTTPSPQPTPEDFTGGIAEYLNEILQDPGNGDYVEAIAEDNKVHVTVHSWYGTEWKPSIPFTITVTPTNERTS